MSGKDMLFLFAVMACVIVIGLFFWIPIWILSGRAYICDPESNGPISVQERINEESMIQGGFGGY